MQTPTFTERLARRHRIWWRGDQPQWHRRFADRLHRIRESRTFRHRDDPEALWHCCPYWPRTLLNKWNGREFAARHGCVVAELLWWGSDHKAIPWDHLGPAFVIRPAWGTARRGVVAVAGGQELIQGMSPDPERLEAALLRTDTLRRPMTVLAEAFVHNAQGADQLPLEIKCHTFVDEVVALEVETRELRDAGPWRVYTPQWEPVAMEMYEGAVQNAPLLDPPTGLDAMLAQAVRLGRAVGTYMRFDFFASTEGPVFNEFSSTPRWSHPFSRHLDEWFGGLWAERCPDQL